MMHIMWSQAALPLAELPLNKITTCVNGRCPRRSGHVRAGEAEWCWMVIGRLRMGPIKLSAEAQGSTLNHQAFTYAFAWPESCLCITGILLQSLTSLRFPSVIIIPTPQAVNVLYSSLPLSAVVSYWPSHLSVTTRVTKGHPATQSEKDWTESFVNLNLNVD